MANISTFALPGVSSCIDAQTFLGSSNQYENMALNGDVGGPLIAISNVLINLCLPFLLMWSPNVTSYIIILFSQTYPIVLASLLSGLRNGDKYLTLFDSHYALTVSFSPLSLYISTCCILQRFGVETVLFSKIPTSEARAIILWLGIAFLPLWLGLSLFTSFSTTAFSNSYYCAGMTFPAYLEFLLISSWFGALDIVKRDLIDDLLHRKGLGLVSLLGIWTWGVYLVRRREQIIEKYHERHQRLVDEDGPGTPPKRRLFRRYVLLAWYVPKVCWDVVRKHHPFMIMWFVGCLGWSWTSGIVNPVAFNMEKLSFGDIISIFSPAPCLIGLFGIIRQKEKDLKRFFFKIPSFLSRGVCYIIFGKRRWDDRQKIDRDYFHWSRCRWVLVLLGWLAFTCLQGVWIWSYVRTGTHPNQRTVLNEPHRNWKPFSIMMYISGYIVSVINMFVFLAAFDYCQKLFLSPNGSGVSPSSFARVIRSLVLTVLLIVALFMASAPLFGGFISLPTSQEWHWLHECKSFPTEIILDAQPNPNIPSTISFYTIPTQSQLEDHPHPPEKEHVIDFVYYDVLGTKVLEYRPVDNTTLSKEFEPSIKTMFFNKTQFFGCSSNFSATTLRELVANPEARCSEVSGSYTKNPNLFFSILTASPLGISFIGAKHREYEYQDDAPSFSLHYATADGNLTDKILLRSALTKRNKHSVLKVCSNEMATAEVLGTLGLVFLKALEEYSVFINRAKVFSF